MDKVFWVWEWITNRGEGAMKKLTSWTTTSWDARRIALEVQERTWIDLITEARLRQFTMELAWDERAKTFFWVLAESPNVFWIAKNAVEKATWYIIWATPEKRARAIIRNNTIPKNKTNKGTSSKTKKESSIFDKLPKIDDKKVDINKKAFVDFWEMIPKKIDWNMYSKIPDKKIVFNKNLKKLKNWKLNTKYVFNLWMPNENLQIQWKIWKWPIKIIAEHLLNKSKQSNHPFDLMDLKDLPDKIQNPIAIFESITEPSHRILLTELKSNNKNFVVVLKLITDRKWTEINSIRSVYPRNLSQTLNLLKQDKWLYLNEKKLKKLFDENNIKFDF